MKRKRFARKAVSQIRGPIARLFGSRSCQETPETKKDPFSDSPPEAGVNLAVMSFNIRRGTAQDGKNHWMYRRHLVHEMLSQYRPDVLGLQEAMDFQIAQISAMLPGYGWVGTGNLGGSEGLHNTIFYNTALFALSGEGTFWLSDTPRIPGSRGWGNIIPRICTWARLIDKKSGLAFYFYNAHLDHISLRSRKKSVFSLIQQIYTRPTPDPFILTGDFNARERSSPIRYLKGKAPLKIKTRAAVFNPIPLVDTFRARYPKNRNTVTFHGFRRYLFRFKLDYIFVPPCAQVLDAEIIQLRWNKRYPSDHFPLLAHIGLPVKTVPSYFCSLPEEAVNSPMGERESENQ